MDNNTDQPTLSHEDRKKLIPENAYRVQVRTVSGDLRYRDLSVKSKNKIRDDDEILISEKGDPIVMYNKPGRRKNIETTKLSVPAVNATAATLQKDKERHMRQDKLLRLLEVNPESPDVLHEIMTEIAKESASLEFERLQAERKLGDTRQISVNRVQTLKAVGDTWIKRLDQVSIKGVDLESPAFRTVLKFLIKTFRECMLSTGMRREQIEVVINTLATTLDSDQWEAEAISIVKGEHKGSD